MLSVESAITLLWLISNLVTDCIFLTVPNQPGGAFRVYMASLLLLFQLTILARQFPSGRLLTLI
jgi:hypothetical protein